MFTLDKIHTFPPELARCKLAAYVSLTHSTKVLWSLTLESQRIHSEVIPPEERVPGFDMVGLCIRGEDVELLVSSWAPLRIPMQSIKRFGGASGFRLQEWEPLLALRLEAEALDAQLVDIVADGTGGAESVPEWFRGPQVDFKIHTRASFGGVSIYVPTDIQDALGYADTIRNTLIPSYPLTTGHVQRQTHSGILMSVMVHYAPT